MQEQNQKLNVRLPLLLGLMMAVGIFIGLKLPKYDKDLKFYVNAPHQVGAGSAFDEIVNYINSKYVDTVDTESIQTEAINKLLDALDPHSVYITPEELSAVEESMQGNFEGIGVEYMIIKDTITVITPLAGGPSEAAGILAGDKLVMIDDSTVAGVGIDNPQIFKYLRGEKGSPVSLGILRGKEKKLRTFDIKRDVIPIHSVETAYLLDENTAYVKINRFSGTTFQEFVEEMNPLVREKGARNLILDLRGNPGGYLHEAVDLLSQFFPKNKLMVYTQGRTEEKRTYESTGRQQFNMDNIAVLIDEGSASASEIVAGAIQDYDRGWIIGRRSFGKGLVQEQYPLRNGGAVRITVARYYTPSGRCIQRAYKDNEEYNLERNKRLESGELSDESKIEIADSSKYYTGAGRIVYGGGGITPDVFIPLDTGYFNDVYFAARQQVPAFVSSHIDDFQKNGAAETLDAFVSKYDVSDAMVQQLLDESLEEGRTLVFDIPLETRIELKHQIKVRAARMLFKAEGMYRVLNESDPAIEKARAVLDSGSQVSDK